MKVAYWGGGGGGIKPTRTRVKKQHRCKNELGKAPGGGGGGNICGAPKPMPGGGGGGGIM